MLFKLLSLAFCIDSVKEKKKKLCVFLTSCINKVPKNTIQKLVLRQVVHYSSSELSAFLILLQLHQSALRSLTSNKKKKEKLFRKKVR